jgi:hypothetical protein
MTNEQAQALMRRILERRGLKFNAANRSRLLDEALDHLVRTGQLVETERRDE